MYNMYMSAYPAPPAPPYPYPPPYYAPPPPRKSGCSFSTCLLILLIFIVVSCCCLAVLGGGGYFLFTSGKISSESILAMAGMANGRVTVLNLSESELSASLEEMEPKAGEEPARSAFIIQPYEMDTAAGKPGLHRLVIDYAGKQEECVMRIASGAEYNLIAVDEGVAISRKGADTPAAPAEMDLKTSPLCTH